MLVSCQGCSGATGVLLLLALLLLLAALAAGGYAIGRLQSRGAHGAELREARAGLRQTAALQDGWAWQTDTAHRSTLWRGPAVAVGGSTAGDAEALLTHPALADALRTEQAFTGIAVDSRQAVDGNHHWLLRGVPRHDDDGRFAGFAGSARPLDGEAGQRAAAAALPALLSTLAAPALVGIEGPGGWQLLQANAAALTLWPALRPAAPLPLPLAGLPAALADALAAAQPADAEADGWHLQLLTGPELAAMGRRGLLLSQAPAAAEPAAATASEESDNFSFTVSHDLRAPIRVVEGFTRIVKEDYGRLLDRVGNDHLDRVLGAAARMNLMIDALLTLARLSTQPLASQPVNLSQLAGYVVDDLRRAAPEREADVHIEPGLATRGDPTLLRLVLENLLGNAWKYSARTPRAQISLRQAAAMAGQQGSTYVVRDNGAGFDMRSAERLFGLFQRLHSTSEFAGHGVGLASVRRIVRRHGGEIWAEAEPGRGAAFFFSLA